MDWYSYSTTDGLQVRLARLLHEGVENRIGAAGWAAGVLALHPIRLSWLVNQGREWKEEIERMSHSSRDSLWDWDEITVEDLMGEEDSTLSSSYVALGSDFSAMDASAQAEIGHAMARTAKLLLAVAADAAQAVLSPPPPLVDNDESYEPYTGHGCSPAED